MSGPRTLQEGAPAKKSPCQPSHSKIYLKDSGNLTQNLTDIAKTLHIVCPDASLYTSCISASQSCQTVEKRSLFPGTSRFILSVNEKQKTVISARFFYYFLDISPVFDYDNHDVLSGEVCPSFGNLQITAIRLNCDGSFVCS